MPQLITQARPYARAAFEVAKVHADVAGWLSVLQSAGELMSQVELADYISNPKVSATMAINLFADVLVTVTERQKNFLTLLAENKQLNLLPSIAVLFTYFHEQDGDVASVEVQSATSLTAAQQQRLQAALEARLKKTVKLNCTVNTELMGGALIRTPEWVMDGSVKGKLQQMKTKIVG